MIETYVDSEGHVVQAMRMTGTASSAKKVCRWLGISQWCVASSRDGTYCVRFPDFMHPDFMHPVFAYKGDWVVRSSHNISEALNGGHGVTTWADKDFRATYERV